MSDPQWDGLVIERRSTPPRLSDEQFREWIRARPIFVSSPIDDEMTPFREAVRTRMQALGAEPVMWETITPQDRLPENAYLDGVDRSDLVVLLVGRRYGIPDRSGYSATAKEAQRAESRGIPRLLFERELSDTSERDGKLNDWLRSLYVEVAGGKYRDSAALEEQLEVRLRDVAASQESTWVKLDSLVFPGQVARRTGTSGLDVTAHAVFTDGAARQRATELATSRYRGEALLTWGVASMPVNVMAVDIETAATSRDRITINMSGIGSPGIVRTLWYGTVTYGDRSAEPPDQVVQFVDAAVFGKDPGKWDRLVRSVFGTPAPTLPSILTTTGADSWTAEGIARLYIVENLISRFGGYFAQLQIGPATSKFVRVRASFVPGWQGAEPLELDGQVAIGSDSTP